MGVCGFHEKKIFLLLLTCALVLSFSACGNAAVVTNDGPDTATEQTENTSEAKENISTETESSEPTKSVEPSSDETATDPGSSSDSSHDLDVPYYWEGDIYNLTHYCKDNDYEVNLVADSSKEKSVAYYDITVNGWVVYIDTLDGDTILFGKKAPEGLDNIDGVTFL